MERGEKLAMGIRMSERCCVDFYKVYMDKVAENMLRPLELRKNRIELINDAINSPAPSYYAAPAVASRLMDEVFNRYFIN